MMHFYSLAIVELKRIIQSKITWLIIILTICTPIAGYLFYTPATTQTRSSIFIANPVLAASLIGAVLFGLFTLYELDRINRNNMSTLTDAIVSPAIFTHIHIFSLVCCAIITTLLVTLIYLPYTLWKMQYLFVTELYFSSFFILMLPSLIFSIFITASLYQIIRRFDLSFILFIIFVLLSLSKYCSDNFLLRWINPLIPVYSDDFSNTRILRMTIYNRFFWALILLGCYFFCLLCIRKYGKNLFGSIKKNIKQIYLPIISILLILFGYFVYLNQPYIDHSSIDYVEEFETINENLFLKNTHTDIKLNVNKGTMSGNAAYQIENKITPSKPQECSLWLNPGYKVKKIMANGQPLSFTDLNNDVNNKKEVKFTLPSGKELALTVEYGGFPQEWSMSRTYIWGSEINKRYIDLSSTAFCPALSILWDEEPYITSTITLPKDMTIVATGEQEKIISQNNDGTTTWAIKDVGDRISLYAGDYVKKTINVSGINMEFYYSRKHDDIMNRIKVQETIEQVVNYCASHYGTLPFTEEYPLKLVQSTAYRMGGGAYRNFSQMGETTFSEYNLSDPKKGANGTEVLAHEISHQWWGLGVMTLDEDCWSSEGLTVYTTYRMMKEKHGEEYGKKYYVDQWKNSLDNLNRSFYHRHPEYLSILPEKYASTIQASEWSTQVYDIMPLQLLKAAKILGGEDKLDEVLAELYQNGGTEMPPYITYQDFLTACGLKKEEISVE